MRSKFKTSNSDLGERIQRGVKKMSQKREKETKKTELSFPKICKCYPYRKARDVVSFWREWIPVLFISLVADTSSKEAFFLPFCRIYMKDAIVEVDR